MDIVLYTTDCPQCRVLESLLTSKGLQHQLVTDFIEINRVAAAAGLSSVPIMKLDGMIMSYPQAIRWVNEYQKEATADDSGQVSSVQEGS